jgi:transposase InsO family protein
VASPSPPLPNPVVVPCTHLQLEVLRGPLDSAQYTSYVFGRRLREAGILQSMGRTGTPADNAVIESFFDTMKLELLTGRRYRTRGEAKAAIFEWIEVFYNRLRRHSTIGNVSPAEFERRYADQVAAG